MHKSTFFKSISLYLVIATFFMTLPAQGWAMFVPSAGAAPLRGAEISNIQRSLESTMIRQRLADFGLSSEEVMARMNTLSDQQVHQFASNLDSLQAGADGVDGLISSSWSSFWSLCSSRPRGITLSSDKRRRSVPEPEVTSMKNVLSSFYAEPFAFYLSSRSLLSPPLQALPRPCSFPPPPEGTAPAHRLMLP